MRAVGALWLRELKRYFRSRSRIIGSLGQPILFLIALGYGLGSVFQRAGSGNYIHFLVPGIMAQAILFTAIFSGIQVIWDRQFGFLKEVLVAPVPRMAVMLGRTFGGATVATIQGSIVLILSYIVGFRVHYFASLPGLVLAMFLMALLFTSLGTAVASVVNDMQGFQLIMNFLVMPLFFLSGALFPLAAAPAVLRGVAAFNPLSYGTDAMRALLIHANHYTLAHDLLFLAVGTVLFVIIGSYLFSRIQA